MRRPALRCAALLAALLFLLPVAVLADSCEDCLWASSPECCPPSCCSCCVPGPSGVAASVWPAPHPTMVAVAPVAQDDPHPTVPPRDIFHVPKPSLV